MRPLDWLILWVGILIGIVWVLAVLTVLEIRAHGWRNDR